MSRSPSYSAWPISGSFALIEGYTEKPDRWVADFRPEDAGPIGRELTRTDTDQITFEVELTFAEHATLLTFYHTTLVDGILPFTFTHPRTGVTAAFAFIDAPQIKAVLPLLLVVTLPLRKLP